MLKAIHAQEDKEAARQKAVLVADKLRGMKLDSVAKFVEDSVAVKYKEQMKHPMQFQKQRVLQFKNLSGCRNFQDQRR